MKNLRVSDDVWQAIAQIGKFGETENDVLRRVFSNEGVCRLFSITPTTAVQTTTTVPRTSGVRRQRHATNRMSAHIADGILRITFADGASKDFKLPSREDRDAIRTVRDNAWQFAKEHQASIGQRQAIVHVMCDNEYRIQ